MINNWWEHYKKAVKGKTILRIAGTENDLAYWQDLLFFNFLFYCLPISFIAVIPGIVMAIKDDYILIAVVDLASLALLALITFLHPIPLYLRKLFVIVIFYILSIFLINFLGYIGPGIFYLFAITILIALVFPKGYAYWSIVINGLILLCFVTIIYFNLFNCALNQQYSVGKWIAFSSNLIFLSVVLVALINRIFRSLQHVINKEAQLQDRYRSIFDKSPIPMWTFDVETLQFLNVNEAAIRHYGYSESEFLQMTIKDIRRQASAGGLQELVEANRKTGQYYHGHAEHVKKNGDKIYVRIESNFMVSEGREIRLVLATDVTDHLNSEHEVNNANLKIKQSEASLRAIFESTADGFVLLDEQLVIKAFNAKAKKYILLNKIESDFEAGRNILDFVEPSRQTFFKEVIEKVYKNGFVEYDRRFRPDGHTIQWIRFTLTPVYQDQVIKGICITGRDVTVRKLYLQNLEDQNRTFRDISWMQSHLVRAPLARILGLTHLLKVTSYDDLDQTIDYLELSAHELDAVINKITEKSNKIVAKYPIPADLDNNESKLPQPATLHN